MMCIRDSQRLWLSRRETLYGVISSLVTLPVSAAGTDETNSFANTDYDSSYRGLQIDGNVKNPAKTMVFDRHPRQSQPMKLPFQFPNPAYPGVMDWSLVK
jgi:hypothetical protein